MSGALLIRLQRSDGGNQVTVFFCLIEPKRSWTCFAQMESAHDRSSLSLIVYCPSCFTAVEALPENASDHCHLCKSLLSNSDRGSRTLAVKLDLQIQQRESRQLQ